MDERRRENAISTSRFQLRSEARLQAQYAKEVAQCAVKDRICDAPAAQYEEERRKWFVCAGWLYSFLLGFSHVILSCHYNYTLLINAQLGRTTLQGKQLMNQNVDQKLSNYKLKIQHKRKSEILYS